ncbi:cysteinyl-tRNA synthetase, partial [Coemansia helicoidea]
VPFVPREGNRVSWYGCGPTVYDASHMGHAFNYVSLDIMRRIMEDYLGYDLTVVMNITDIDDKIIERTRHEHLVAQYRAKAETLSEQLVADVGAALCDYANTAFPELVAAKLGSPIGRADDWRAFAAAVNGGQDPALAASSEKALMRYDAADAAFEALVAARQSLADGKSSQAAAVALVDTATDVLAPWLDAQFRESVTDPRLFRNLSAYWENDYMADMDALNVRRPNVLTRVSEFVEDIVRFVQRIIDNGYAYEAEGSVYFDVEAFDGTNGHVYAKMSRRSKDSAKLLAEGEGSLTKRRAEKQGERDFALWKSSQPGEPAWPSPWGPGRPGWHIECSAMASEILGQNIDIHTGGIDLVFPHHENEMVQSEACFENHQWVNYFLHTGHLHIAGRKMSKSLKNFITIKDALKKYSARQLRTLFLLTGWSSGINFSDTGMDEAIAIEKTLSNFFSNAAALVRDLKQAQQPADPKRQTNEPEIELLAALADARDQVHSAILDSFDTPRAMRAILDIVARTTAYLQRGRESIDPQPVEMVAQYVTKIMRAFGMADDSATRAIGWGSGAAGTAGADRETTLLPVASALSDFRDSVRELALAGGDKKALLALCDRLRDQVLPELGVVIDDHGDGRALVKVVDPAEIRRARELSEAKDAAKQLAKAKEAQLAEEKRLALLEKAKVPPQDMFRTPEMRELYSAWDESGIPTKDAAGEDLSKSRAKKLAKDYD